MGTAAARRASHSDATELAALLAEAQRARSGARDGQALVSSLSVDDETLVRYLEDPQRVVLLGTLNDDIVGICCACLEGRVGTIEILYVQGDHRLAGVGRSMFAVLEQWATEHQLEGLDVLALPGDRSTKSFLEQMGYRARLITMRKRS